jgi:hypothetical protein
MTPTSIIAPVLAFSMLQPAHAGDPPCPNVTPAMDEAARGGACIDAAIDADATIAEAYRRASQRDADGWDPALDELVYNATRHCVQTTDPGTLRSCDELLTAYVGNLERLGKSSDHLRPRRDQVKERVAAAAPDPGPGPVDPPPAAAVVQPPATDASPVPRRLWAGLGVSAGLLVTSGILGGVSMARYLAARDVVDDAATMGPAGSLGRSICDPKLDLDVDCDKLHGWRASFLTSAVVFAASAAALTAVGVLIGRHRKHQRAASTSFHAAPTRGGLFAGVTLRF